jgi:hypothetical protein
MRHSKAVRRSYPARGPLYAAETERRPAREGGWRTSGHARTLVGRSMWRAHSHELWPGLAVSRRRRYPPTSGSPRAKKERVPFEKWWMTGH